MIAIPWLLASVAEQSGIKVPENIDEFEAEDYPHYFVFSRAQLGRRMPRPDSHWKNARLVRDIGPHKIQTITFAQLLALGFE